MMAKVFTALLCAALVFGLLGGQIGQVAAAMPQGAADAVELALSVGGALCVWSGILEIMDQSGLSRKIARGLGPVIRQIFGSAAQDEQTMEALSQNMAANLLGLGSAATPAGLRAAARLAQRQGKPDCDAFLLLMALNSASLQLLPANVAAVRAAAGAADPFSILPAVWLASAASVCVVLLVSRLLARVWPA